MRAPRDFTCPALQVVISLGTSSGGRLASGSRWRRDAHRCARIHHGSGVHHAPVRGRAEKAPAAAAVADPRIGRPEQRCWRCGWPHPMDGSSSRRRPTGPLTRPTSSLQKDLGGLKLSVALRPDAAGRLGHRRTAARTAPAGRRAARADRRSRRRRARAAAARSGAGAAALRLRLRRLARAAHAAGADPHVLGNAAARPRPVRAEGRRSLEIIARESQRLAQLVENVLLFSRGERRTPEISPRARAARADDREVVESFAPLAAARQARIVTRSRRHAVSANVDAGALRQILLNLLDNAVKYGPPDRR